MHRKQVKSMTERQIRVFILDEILSCPGRCLLAEERPFRPLPGKD